MNKNIVLCGFMGSGKTTVGKQLSAICGKSFFDSDSLVESENKMAVSEIFEKYSEEYFRQEEQKAILTLSKKNGVIISVGGGAVMNSDNVKALKENGIIVFLDITAETAISRLKNDASRPLLNKGKKQSEISSLLNKRLPIYKAAADFCVDANGSPKVTAEKIYEILAN